MLRLYGVEDQRPDLVELALEARRRDAFWQAYGDVPPEHRTYVELEQSAVLIRQFECLAVPGLLQSREYAAALSRAIFPNATTQHIDWPALPPWSGATTCSSPRCGAPPFHRRSRWRSFVPKPRGCGVPGRRPRPAAPAGRTHPCALRRRSSATRAARS